MTRRAATGASRGTRRYSEPSGDVLVKAAAKGDDKAIAGVVCAAGVPVDSAVTKQRHIRFGQQLDPGAGRHGPLSGHQGGISRHGHGSLEGGSQPQDQADDDPGGADHPDACGDTPLIELQVLRRSEPEVCSMIQAGADVNAITRGSSTALRAAEKGHCVEIAGILREQGAARSPGPEPASPSARIHVPEASRERRVAGQRRGSARWPFSKYFPVTPSSSRAGARAARSAPRPSRR